MTKHFTLKCPKSGNTFDVPCEKRPNKVELKAMGYEGFTVTAQHDDRPPPPELDDQAKERARVRALDPVERYGELLAQIENLTARVAKLEGN